MRALVVNSSRALRTLGEADSSTATHTKVDEHDIGVLAGFEDDTCRVRCDRSAMNEKHSVDRA